MGAMKRRCSGTGKMAIPCRDNIGVECPDCGLHTIPYKNGSVRRHGPLQRLAAFPHAEAPLTPDTRRQTCDKCKRDLPIEMIAVEVEDGHPIDDPVGFMWCIVCHAKRVFSARDKSIRVLAAELRDAKKLADALNLGQHEYQKRQRDVVDLTEKWADRLDTLATTST